jgi:hypothetical protein
MLWILSRHQTLETRVTQFVEIRDTRIGGVIAYADRTTGEVFVHPVNIISIPVQSK